VNLALDIAPEAEGGTVWVNSTNLFDAAAGFGGYRESGFGREGGREGLWEYVKPAGSEAAPDPAGVRRDRTPGADRLRSATARRMPPIDRTAKLYIGGKQARPDSGYSSTVRDADGRPLGEVGQGNRKDVRNAVEAAHKAAAGRARPRTTGRRCSTTSPRTWRRGRRVRAAASRADRGA
jgi:aldehyde dehydrogenase (NAD+)